MHMERRLLLGGDQRLSTTTGATRGPAPPGGMSRTRTRRCTDLVTQLDSGTLTDAGALQRLLNEIREELGELGLPALPVGLVAECFLGPPFRVHTIDLVGEIVHHYQTGETMPPSFERARSLALHPAYVVIEVYADRMVAIRSDGTAVDV